MGTKICKLCELNKSFDEFYIRKNSKDGYRNSCKKCDKEKSVENYKVNLTYIKTKNKEWREANSEKIKKYKQLYYTNNPNYRRNYQIKNKERINIRNKNRRNVDGKFRIKENVRNLIKNSFKNNNCKKNTKSELILGCTLLKFKQHIESKFETWMNWGNYGNPKGGILVPNKTWDIDHIVPISTAKTEEDVIRLNHYTNLQPLCSYNNRLIKRNK